VNSNTPRTKLTIAATAAFCLVVIAFVVGRGSVHQSTEWKLNHGGNCRFASNQSVVCQTKGAATHDFHGYALNMTGSGLVVWATNQDGYNGEVFRVNQLTYPDELPRCTTCADPY